MPSAAVLIPSLLFGSVGFVAFRVGLKRSAPWMIVVGAALMGYPYFLDAAWALWAVGAGLCGALYYVWE